MDADLASLADARNNMVDGQLRPSKVTDRRILDAMRRLPRENFVPPEQRARAYADDEVPVGGGRVLLAPLTVARLIQASGAGPGTAVLVLGAGYAAAVFAAIGAQVTAVEPDLGPAAQMTVALRACGGVIAVRRGPLAAGWAAEAPYDVIFVDGAVAALPDLAAQLRADPPGKLCAILIRQERAGVATIAERTAAGLAQRPLFDCTATLMPTFAPAARFVF